MPEQMRVAKALGAKLGGRKTVDADPTEARLLQRARPGRPSYRRTLRCVARNSLEII